MEHRRPLPLRRLHHPQGQRKGRRCQTASRPASARPSSRAARAPAASTSTTSSSTSKDSPSAPPTSGPASARATPTGCTTTPPASSASATATTCAGCTSRRRRSMPTATPASASSRSAPPATRKRDVTGRQWDQRVEVMRNSMIYFRNNPGILFWEAGNTVRHPRTRCSRWSICASSGTPTAGASWALAGQRQRPANTADNPSPSTTAS